MSRVLSGIGSGLSGSNFWSGAKSFGARGGFSNGLNPSIVNNIWYVNANAITDMADGAGPIGSDSNNGLSPLTPFATIARAFEFVQTYDIIVVSGVIREQVVAPDGIFDVTIMGSVVTPRQATSGGVATNGGASWLSPTVPVAATPLLELTRAGWSILNMQFSPVAASACVRLTRSAVVDLIDASHAYFGNCLFSGGAATPIGIEDNGGCGFVVIENCRFTDLTSGIKSLNTTAAIPLRWRINNNRFTANTNDITMSLSFSLIKDNDFMTAGNGAVNKVISTTFVAVQGGNNHVRLNQFSNTEAQIAPGNGYTGAASDTWMNYVNDQAALAFGQPA